MRTDLHTHSSYSDGTDTPAEILKKAAAADLGMIALTDHDTTEGWVEAEEAVSATGVGLIRGMEVSCVYYGLSIHILSYLHDPVHSQLAEVTTNLRFARKNRIRIMAERLSEDFPIDYDSVLLCAGNASTLGRPHIADALVRAGVIPTRDDAFTHILSPRGPYYEPIPAITPQDAIRLIHEAGGVAVFAHPFASSRGRVVTPQLMQDIISAGLDGVEIEHRDNSSAGRETLRTLAAEHDLIITGSSDYHGMGKINRLGENTTEWHMVERILAKAQGNTPLVP